MNKQNKIITKNSLFNNKLTILCVFNKNETKLNITNKINKNSHNNKPTVKKN